MSIRGQKSLFRRLFPPKPLGQRGEDLAARYLRRAGYRILARNLKLGAYEIDIVTRDTDTTIFVEVKTRTSSDPVPPEENVTRQKEDHIRSAANTYISRENDPKMYYRFDIVAVTIPPSGDAEIRHIPDAFR